MLKPDIYTHAVVCRATHVHTGCDMHTHTCAHKLWYTYPHMYTQAVMHTHTCTHRLLCTFTHVHTCYGIYTHTCTHSCYAHSHMHTHCGMHTPHMYTQGVVCTPHTNRTRMILKKCVCGLVLGWVRGCLKDRVEKTSITRRSAETDV